MPYCRVDFIRYFSCEPDRKRTPRWPSHRTIRLKVLIRLRTKWPSGSSVIPSLTSLTLWAPFQSSVINHTAVTLPEKLVPLTAIPMGKFIHELNEIQTYVYLCVCLMTYNYWDMSFLVRSNDSFNFPLGWMKYIVIVVIVIVVKQNKGRSFWTFRLLLQYWDYWRRAFSFTMGMDRGLSHGLTDLSQQEWGWGEQGSLTQIQHRWLSLTQQTMMTSTERLPRHRWFSALQRRPASMWQLMPSDSTRRWRSWRAWEWK